MVTINESAAKNAPKRLTEKHLEILKDRCRLSLYYQPDSVFFHTVEQNFGDSEPTLGDEIKLLRVIVLEMIEKVKDGGKTVASNVNELGNQSSEKQETFTLKEKAIIIKQLAEAIGRLVKIEAEIQSSNVITLNAFRAWMGAFVREVKDAFPAQGDQMKFVKISRKIGEPKRG